MYKENIGWSMVEIEHIFWGSLIWPRLDRNAEISGSFIIAFFLLTRQKNWENEKIINT